MAFVDVDADGACSSADVAEYEYAVWNGDFLAPSFTATIDELSSDTSFVCDSAP